MTARQLTPPPVGTKVRWVHNLSLFDGIGTVERHKTVGGKSYVYVRWSSGAGFWVLADEIEEVQP